MNQMADNVDVRNNTITPEKIDKMPRPPIVDLFNDAEAEEVLFAPEVSKKRKREESLTTFLKTGNTIYSLKSELNCLFTSVKKLGNSQIKYTSTLVNKNGKGTYQMTIVGINGKI